LIYKENLDLYMKQNQFLKVPEAIIARQDLTPLEILIYSDILSLCSKRQCFASNEWFAERWGVTDRQVRRIIEKLSGLDLIEITQKTPRKIKALSPVIGQDTNVQSPGHISPKERTQMSAIIDVLKDKKNKENIPTPDVVGDANDFFFNSEERSSAAYEIESLTRYEKVCQLWKTSESQPIKKTVYSHFKKLSPEAQQKMLDYLQALPTSKLEILSKIWMGPFLKNKMFTPEVLEQEIKNQENFIKTPKNGKRKIESPDHNTGGFSPGGFFRR
jgi:hypothetical protein